MLRLGAMFGLGGWEIALLVIAGLVFFGPKKLPQLMRQAGKIMHEVKKASTEFQFSIERELEDDEYKRQHRRAKKRAKKLEQKGITEDPALATAPGDGTHNPDGTLKPVAETAPPAPPVGPSPVVNGNGSGNGSANGEAAPSTAADPVTTVKS